MRAHLSIVDESHVDWAVLSALQVEIANRVGGLSALKQRFPLLVRDAVDFVLDSVRTARTRVTELDNVEKTFIGLKLEHFVRDMLDVPKGVRDLVVAGIDVDIKNTVGGNWSIPQETYRSSEPCLLMAINDQKCTCSLGLIIAKLEYLHGGAGNRDTKRGVSTAGFANILWLVADSPYPPSRFSGLNMERFRELRKSIRSGSRRAAQFWRENLRHVVHRDVMQALLFDQYDYMKRLRSNKGAPDILQHENIAIFIGTYVEDRRLAAKLGITSLGRDEVVGVAARNQQEWQLMKFAGVVSTAQWTS
jgi:hypothetical protein